MLGFRGDFVYDNSKSHSTLRKLLDSSRIMALGWRPKVGPCDGIPAADRNFLRHQAVSA